MKNVLAVVSAALLSAACRDTATAPDVMAPPTDAVAAASVAAVPDEYLVQLREDTRDVHAAAATAGTLGGRVFREWHTALKGYAVRLPAGAVQQLLRDPRVIAIEPNRRIAAAWGQRLNTSSNWGLDRIDQATLPLDQQYLFGDLGEKVHVYIIDSGIRPTHWEFDNRATWGADFADGDFTDCLGHGTYVASLVGGFTYGVVKKASLVAVRVYGCTSYTSEAQIISAVDWVTANAQFPAVANISSVPTYSPIGLYAFAKSVAAGIVYTHSAGNSPRDVCSDPQVQRLSGLVMLVGASGGWEAPGDPTAIDVVAPYSSYGSCLSLFAPGTTIRGASNSSDFASVVASGTSGSAPIVAGVAAAVLNRDPQLDPYSVMRWIDGWARRGLLSGVPVGTPNKLLFKPSLVTGNQPPLANFIYSTDSINHRIVLSGIRTLDDQSGTQLTYRWTNDAGRPTKFGTSITQYWSLHWPNTFNETLGVRDAGGLTSTMTRSVTIK